MIAVTKALVTYEKKFCNQLNNIKVSGSEPLTMLGIVVAAVALRFVPNCSAPIVTKIAQKPVAKPSPKHMA